jgi:hypothetical protein
MRLPSRFARSIPVRVRSAIISSRVLLMNKSYTLMTSNISKDLKSRFDALTEIHQVTKTSVLIEFIETYFQKQEFKNVEF